MSAKMTSSSTLKRATMLASLVALLVACGGQATPTAAPTTAPQPTSAPEATTAPEPTAAATEAAATEATATTETATTDSTTTEATKYKGEIVISTNGANPDYVRWSTLIEAYNKLQPDVKVIVEGPPSGVDYAQWLGTQLAAGEPSAVRPDIVSGNYQPTYANYVNLDKYILGTNPYTGNAWNDDVDWSFWQERNTRGERIMLPTEAVHILWFYNKDILDKAGVQPPTTWDELVSACEKIEASTKVKCVGSNYQWKLNQWILEIYWDQYARDNIDIVRCQPGDYCYDENVDGKFKFDPSQVMVEGTYNKNYSRYYAAIRDGKIKFDTPEMADMVANLAKVFPKHASDSLFIDSTEYSQFLQGQVAMTIDGTWSLGSMTRDMKSLTSLTADRMKELGISDTVKLQPFAWGTFETPGMTGPLVKFQPVRSIESATGVYASIIDKSAEQTEMVLDFLMFWFSKPGYQAYVDGDMKDPLTPGGYNPGGPVMVKGVTIPEDYQKLMDNVKMMGNVENGLFLPLRFNVDSIDKEAQNKLKDALEGKITPQDYATWLQKTWTDNFDAIIKKAGLTQADLDNPARDPAAK